MRHIGVLEAKTRFSALLDGLEKNGESIVITRHGKPVARLSAEAPVDRESDPLSGAELLARSRAFWELQPVDPEFDNLTWEEMKKIARS